MVHQNYTYLSTHSSLLGENMFLVSTLFRGNALLINESHIAYNKYILVEYFFCRRIIFGWNTFLKGTCSAENDFCHVVRTLGGTVIMGEPRPGSLL